MYKLVLCHVVLGECISVNRKYKYGGALLVRGPVSAGWEVPS